MSVQINKDWQHGYGRRGLSRRPDSRLFASSKTLLIRLWRCKRSVPMPDDQHGQPRIHKLNHRDLRQKFKDPHPWARVISLKKGANPSNH